MLIFSLFKIYLYSFRLPNVFFKRNFWCVIFPLAQQLFCHCLKSPINFLNQYTILSFITKWINVCTQWISSSECIEPWKHILILLWATMTMNKLRRTQNVWFESEKYLYTQKDSKLLWTLVSEREILQLVCYFCPDLFQ